LLESKKGIVPKISELATAIELSRTDKPIKTVMRVAESTITPMHLAITPKVTVLTPVVTANKDLCIEVACISIIELENSLETSCLDISALLQVRNNAFLRKRNTVAADLKLIRSAATQPIMIICF
jgi:hypothetical protein